MKELMINEELYEYFMSLETEKQRDVAMIQKLMNRVAELEKQVKEAKVC
nr:MAG TPA: hypothetical protein [Caudoviricetes sp.]